MDDRYNFSHVFFVNVIIRLFVIADPFHEVKRKRDKKKEVYICGFVTFSSAVVNEGLNVMLFPFCITISFARSILHTYSSLLDCCDILKQSKVKRYIWGSMLGYLASKGKPGLQIPNTRCKFGLGQS